LQKIVIRGGARLAGEVRVSGSKNAALPILASSLLARGRSIYRNVPALGDVQTMGRLLARLGAGYDEPQRGTAHVDTSTINEYEAPYELVKTMRASVLVLGPLLARSGHARASLPGGCAIGVRPINLHIAAFEKLGAEVSLEHGDVEARAVGLRGADIFFDQVSVTGT